MEAKVLKFSGLPATITEGKVKAQFSRFGALSQMVFEEGSGFVEYKNPICANHAFIEMLPYFEKQGATLTYSNQEEEPPVLQASGSYDIPLDNYALEMKLEAEVSQEEKKQRRNLG